MRTLIYNSWFVLLSRIPSLIKQTSNTKDFTIAHTIFGADGIVLDINVTHGLMHFMDCNYWSCYVHEDERLLIGGLYRMQFSTIRNIAQSENYYQHVRVLTIMEQMIIGVSIAGTEPCADDVVCLKQMMNSEISGENSISIPNYVQTLFHHFVMKKTEIVINLLAWNVHFSKYYKHIDMNVYGYKKFAKLFGYKVSRPMIDFKLFIELFPNLASFTICHVSVGVAHTSIGLSHEFVAKMFECFEYLDKSSSSLSFRRFEIIKPSSSINEFIENNGYKFRKNGWRLKNDKFVGKELYADVGVQQMLLIEKLNR